MTEKNWPIIRKLYQHVINEIGSKEAINRLRNHSGVEFRNAEVTSYSDLVWVKLQDGKEFSISVSIIERKLMSKDELGDRMKKYEDVSDIRLPERIPIIMRIDGRAFHTLTKALERPFDEHFHMTICEVAKVLCREINGVRFAYLQSDEISFLIYPKWLTSNSWFDNRKYKMASVATGLAAVVFDREMRDRIRVLPSFDARLYSMPAWDVPNYFIWRVNDATRNSVSAYARSFFSHKSLHGKKVTDMKAMLQERGSHWEGIEKWKKSGSVVVRQSYEHEGTLRKKWGRVDASDFFNDLNWREEYLSQPTFKPPK